MKAPISFEQFSKDPLKAIMFLSDMKNTYICSII